MNELDQMLKLLGGDHGTLAQILSWIATARVALKPFSAVLLSKLTAALASVAASEEQDDDQIVESVLRSRWYRIIAFTVDLFCSVKIPALKDFKALAVKPVFPPTP